MGMSDDGRQIVDLPSGTGAATVRVGDESRRPVEPPTMRLPGQRAPIPAGPLIQCDGVVKIYKVADLEVVALQGLDLTVQPGEFIAIVGASGSGKSTLLSVLGGLDVPSAGRVIVAGHRVGEMGAAERTRYRRQVLGFVWQQTARNLLPYLSAKENVELPMLLEGVPRGDRTTRTAWLLDLVGLADRGDHRPAQLSGGEQQRVAIAVALANEPALLLADEPTGELDRTPRMTCSSCFAPSTACWGSRSSSSPTIRWSASRSAERLRSATGGRAPRRSADGRSVRLDTITSSPRSTRSSTGSGGCSFHERTSRSSVSASGSGSCSKTTTSRFGPMAQAPSGRGPGGGDAT